jgi:hypothetical protein
MLYVVRYDIADADGFTILELLRFVIGVQT